MISRVFILLLFLLFGFYKRGNSQNLNLNKLEVIFSSRFFHPKDSRDTLNTISVINSIKPDRLDWMYFKDLSSLKLLKSFNLPFSYTINPQMPDSIGYTVNGRLIDLDGRKIGAPWMKNWKQKNPFWGCVNNSTFKKVLLDYLKMLASYGCTTFFFDDAKLNLNALEWGGCFCDSCIYKFSLFLRYEKGISLENCNNYKEYLSLYKISKSKDFSSRAPLYNEFQEFQNKSVINFLTELKDDMTKFVDKKKLVLLCNNGWSDWNSIYQLFDGGICEIPKEKLNDKFFEWSDFLRKKYNKYQAFTLTSSDEFTNISFILKCSKYKFPFVVPWDVLVFDKGGTNRYYPDLNIFKPIIEIVRNGYFLNDSVIEVDGNLITKHMYKFKDKIYCIYVSNLDIRKQIESILDFSSNTEHVVCKATLYLITLKN